MPRNIPRNSPGNTPGNGPGNIPGNRPGLLALLTALTLAATASACSDNPSGGANPQTGSSTSTSASSATEGGFNTEAGGGTETSEGTDTDANTTGDPAGVDIVELTLAEPAGVERSSSHVRWGVPLPQGLIAADDALILVTAAEQVLPTQVRDLSLWPDGSRRWISIDTLADLAPDEVASLTLRVADSPPNNGESLIVSNDDTAITLDTGPLRVEIDKQSGAVLRRAWLDDTLILDVPAEGDRGPFVRSQGTEYLGARLTPGAAPVGGDNIEAYRQWGQANLDRPANRYDPFALEVVVEQEGPVHSVVRISGTHLAADGTSTGTFIVRVHATRGSRHLRVDQTLVYTGADGQGIQSYGFRLPVAGDDDQLEGNPGSGTVIHTAWDEYQVSGQTQSGSALGIASRSDGAVGQAVVLRDMAEHFPKALVLEPGALEVQLYPEDASTWSLERYSNSIDTGNGETGQARDRGAQGIAVSDSWLWVPAVGAFDQDTLDAQARALDAGPLVLQAPAQWYSDASVMGFGAFAFATSSDSAPHSRVHALMHVVADFMRLNQRQQYGWFGIENYGDIRGLFDGGNASFTWSEQGRYGWSGNSGEPSNQLWLQYLRAPSRAVLLDAEAMAKHTLDQTMVHYGDASSIDDSAWNGRNREFVVGSQHRHGRQAWSGYAGFPQYSHLAGVETWYYLSGDERARDALYEAAEFISRYGPNTLEWTGEANGIDVLSRAQAVFFDEPALSTAYDERNSALLEWLDTSAPYYVTDTLSGLDDVGDEFNLFVRVAPGLMYHHERTADPRAATGILAIADALSEPSDPFGLTSDGSNGGVYYHMAPLAYAAGLEGGASVYQELAATILARNCHNTDAADTDGISDASLAAIPEDWRDWAWSWDSDPLDAAAPGILWIDRQITWRNDFMQDYHSYRAFTNLATLAAAVPPGEVQCE